MAREIVVCPRCGSSNVSADATAYWDVDTQSYEIGGTFDAHNCNECEYESKNPRWIDLNTLPRMWSQEWFEYANEAARLKKTGIKSRFVLQTTFEEGRCDEAGLFFWGS